MRLQFTILSPIVISILLLLVKYASGSSSDEKDLTISFQQKQILEKFRELMLPELVHDYMKKDIYLIRWLRAKDFDINEASTMLRNSLKWRKDNDMDGIVDEDFSVFEREYPLSTEVYDINGRPTFIANFGEYDVRKAALAGQSAKLMRYWLKGWEDTERQVRNFQSQGKNITRWNIFFNMDKFSVIEHMCIQCLPFYTVMAKSLELDYPNSISKLWLLNCPSACGPVISLIRPILSPGTNAALKSFGKNQAQWEPIVLTEFDKTQLPLKFGGNNTILEYY